MKRIFVAILSLLMTSASVVAQQTAAPSNFVYDVKMSSGSGPGMNLSLAFTVASTNADGSRTAALVVHSPQMMPLNGKKMNATISRAGAITIGSTGDLTKHYSIMQSKEMSDAASGPMLQMMISPLAEFAAACGKAPSGNVGATWHAFSNATQTDVVYTITGHEQRSGRDTLAVSMTTGSGGYAVVSGHGNYDPAAHLAVSVHSEVRQSAQSPAQVTDVAMSTP